MKKYLTSEITAPLKIIFLGLVLGLGVSVVSAQVPGWSVPPAGTVPPANNAAEPINVLNTTQRKAGVFKLGIDGDFTNISQRLEVNGGAWITQLLGKQGLFSDTLIVGNPFNAATNAVATIWSTLNVENTSDSGPYAKTRIGKALRTYSSNANDYGAPLVIDLEGRGSGGAGRDGLAIFADKSQTYSNIVTNRQLFGVWATSAGQPGSVQTTDGWASLIMGSAFINGNANIGGRVSIGGGNPGANKVLTSSDGYGNAVWADPNTLINQQNVTTPTYYSVRKLGTGDAVTVWCNDEQIPSSSNNGGAVAIGGGGSCDTRDIEVSEPATYNNGNGGYTQLDQTNVTYKSDGSWVVGKPDGWRIKCSGTSGLVRAHVICVSQNYTPPSTPVWTNTSGQGNAGESCNAWLDRSVGAGNYSQYAVRNTTQGTTVSGDCIKQSISNPNKVDLTGLVGSGNNDFRPVSSFTITSSTLVCAASNCSGSIGATPGIMGNLYRTVYSN